MKILLDDCVPAQVRHAFAGHDASTVQEQGWTGIKNGALLATAESAGFNLLVMLTKTFAINIIWPVAGWRFWNSWTNHRPTLEKHFAAIRAAAETLKAGEAQRASWQCR